MICEPCWESGHTPETCRHPLSCPCAHHAPADAPMPVPAGTEVHDGAGEAQEGTQ